MEHSKRFQIIAQLLFTSDISEDETAIAQKAIDIFDKAESDLQNWLDTIENNLNVFKNYHEEESGLVGLSVPFKRVMEIQKQKYEKMLATTKQAIELLNRIQDVEMQDMVTNLTKASEEFTQLYNELTDMQLDPGEKGFAQEFKDASQKVLDNSEPLFDVISRVRDYMLKNIIGEQSLS